MKWWPAKRWAVRVTYTGPLGFHEEDINPYLRFRLRRNAEAAARSYEELARAGADLLKVTAEVIDGGPPAPNPFSDREWYREHPEEKP